MVPEWVEQAGKIAEVCICYTADVLTSSIYNLDYYRDVAKQVYRYIMRLLKASYRPQAMYALIEIDLLE